MFYNTFSSMRTLKLRVLFLVRIRKRIGDLRSYACLTAKNKGKSGKGLFAMTTRDGDLKIRKIQLKLEINKIKLKIITPQAKK